MLIRDLGHERHTVTSALYELDRAIKDTGKKNLLILITGYGSKNGSHKIKSAVINKLNEYLTKNRVKDYLLGEDCDIFNQKYQNFKGRDLIPLEYKNNNNGIIFIFV